MTRFKFNSLIIYSYKIQCNYHMIVIPVSVVRERSPVSHQVKCLRFVLQILVLSHLQNHHPRVLEQSVSKEER